MSELILLSGIFTILGVVVGFFLSQANDASKINRRRGLIKKALINELSIIRMPLSNVTNNKRISDKDYPFITETYDSLKTELTSFLKLDSLVVIQRTYQEIRKMNSEGRGHLVIAGSLDHIFQFTDFDEVIKLIDDSITRLN